MDMTASTPPPLDELRQALAEYLEAVPRQREPNPPDLLALFRRLDELEAWLGSSAHPQLRHYMRNKSYRKAFLFLNGEDAENPRGRCGH